MSVAKNMLDECEIACCELIPYEEIIGLKIGYEFFDEFQDNFPTEYPSASASYTEIDFEQNNFVSLLDTDFLDIYDELAKEDDAFEFGPSPVAMPIQIAEIFSSGVSRGIIQEATLIENSNEKTIKNLSKEKGHNDNREKQQCFENKSEIKMKGAEIIGKGNDTRQISKAGTTNDSRTSGIFKQKEKNRHDAIAKWKRKKSHAAGKFKENLIISARQRATASRTREPQGKFQKAKAKWIVATEYFQSAVLPGYEKELEISDEIVT
jgi:hypothetical protein